MRRRAYLEKDILTLDERPFVLEHWQESTNHINGVSGAFFTPRSLASDFSIEVEGRRIIDLCAGIVSLAGGTGASSSRITLGGCLTNRSREAKTPAPFCPPDPQSHAVVCPIHRSPVLRLSAPVD